MTILKGSLGFKGEHGDSAYELAVKNGYEGTEEEWIEHFGLDLSGYVQTTDVVDNLTSTYTTRPLSANQGKELDAAKQDALVSGTNIKTINSDSLLGSGNITLPTPTEVGDIDNLTTESHVVVGAINELDGDIGDLNVLNTTATDSVVNAINELENEIFFKDGDTFSLPSTVFCGGFVTSSTKQIDFTVVLPKRTDKVSSITINQMQIVGRGISGYLNGSGDYFDCLSSPYSTTYRIVGNNLQLLVDKTTEFTNTTNNTPVGVSLGGGFSITFHE